MDDTTNDAHLTPMAITLDPQHLSFCLHGYYSCFDVLEHRKKKSSLLDKNVISERMHP